MGLSSVVILIFSWGWWRRRRVKKKGLNWRWKDEASGKLSCQQSNIFLGSKELLCMENPILYSLRTTMRNRLIYANVICFHLLVNWQFSFSTSHSFCSCLPLIYESPVSPSPLEIIQRTKLHQNSPGSRRYAKQRRENQRMQKGRWDKKYKDYKFDILWRSEVL